MNLAKVQYLGIFTSNISEKFLYSVTRVKIFFFELQKNFGAAQPVRQNAFHTLITLQPLEQFWSNNHHFIGKIVNFCFFCIPIAVNLKGGPQCAVCVHILNQGFLALTHSNFNNKKKIMPYYVKFDVLSDAITKNQILIIFMREKVKKPHFRWIFGLKMLITFYREFFADREIPYLHCTHRDLQFWSYVSFPNFD